MDFDTYSAVSVNLGRDSLFVASKRKTRGSCVFVRAHVTELYSLSGLAGGNLHFFFNPVKSLCFGEKRQKPLYLQVCTSYTLTHS